MRCKCKGKEDNRKKSDPKKRKCHRKHGQHDLVPGMWKRSCPCHSGKKQGDRQRRGHNADLYEKGNRLILEAELPGIKKDQVDLHAGEDQVTVRVQNIEESKKNHFFWSHRTGIPRERSYTLPYKISPEEVEASMHNGVLTVKMTRSDNKSGKKVPIS